MPRCSSVPGDSRSDCLESDPVHSLEESYPSAEMLSVYSTVAADRAISLVGILLLCRNAVGVFYIPNRLDHSLGVGSYASAENQLVFATAPANGATCWGRDLPLCRDAVGVFYNPKLLILDWKACKQIIVYKSLVFDKDFSIGSILRNNREWMSKQI